MAGLQSASEVNRDLVHDSVRHMVGRVTAEQPEYARSAQVGLPRDDVEVKVLEAFCFGEQGHVGLLARDDGSQCPSELAEQWAETDGFLGR